VEVQLFCEPVALDNVKRSDRFDHQKLAKKNEPLPFHLQGDETMYTRELRRERKRLRDDAQISASIKRYWSLFSNDKEVLKQSGGKGGKEVKRLVKSQYTNFFLKVFRALRQDFDEQEAITCIDTDWASDTSNSDFMSAQEFSRSLFELTDNWTLSAKKTDYLKFLQVNLVSVRTTRPLRL
jgi:hypothetical protein